MMNYIDAIYENGVFKPLVPVALPEHERVSLAVHLVSASEQSEQANAEAMARQREALAQLRAEIDALPPGAPSDGLGGADHDLILYGWQK